ANALNESLDLVVLGEGEPLGQVRARLAQEFDERSRDAFELGALEVLSETQFFQRVRPQELSGELKSEQGLTPAAVAELVGASVGTIRRWYKRGLLEPIDRGARLPHFSTREALVAKRIAFLCSGGLSEDFVEKRLLTFLEKESPFIDENAETFEKDSASTPKAPLEDLPLFSYESQPEKRPSVPPLDLAEIVLKTTLSDDGREILFLGRTGPIDALGQRRFDFAAFPADGTFETPTSAKLSEAEEQIVLAERLAAWNESVSKSTGRPAFLQLFSGREDPFELEEVEEPEQTEIAPPSQDAQEQGATIVKLCQKAWRLERDGYWEEAERAYRLAALAGGREPDVCYRLGRVLFLLGDYSAARERFYNALELDSEYVDARIELGKTFVALGENDAALDAFNKALQEKPNDPTLRVELGKLYLRLDQKQNAVDEFRRAVELVDDPKIADDVARLLTILERRSE
ncbi:MAG: tetratricopeptide repeat protein, partial [Thermoguttaceae bacterium]|nr:tetratricopeptide repeat protein [Thermoguttaceae bacterium]